MIQQRYYPELFVFLYPFCQSCYPVITHDKGVLVKDHKLNDANHDFFTRTEFGSIDSIPTIVDISIVVPPFVNIAGFGIEILLNKSNSFNTSLRVVHFQYKETRPFRYRCADLSWGPVHTTRVIAFLPIRFVFFPCIVCETC
jgi:hypothetical protein